MKIPEYYLPVMPYLILDDAQGFLAYAKRVFNASEIMVVPGEKPDTIMHGEIKIGGAVIMFANSTDAWTEKSSGMFLYVENLDLVYNTAIEQGGTSLQSPEKKEYGYAAGFRDPFGNHWWIAQP